ncbi:amino acid transporter [Meredithblackwellia eburnea MCA 4105]
MFRSRSTTTSASASIDEKKGVDGATPGAVARIEPITEVPEDQDEVELLKLGYRQEFKREFTRLSTISFAFAIMGATSSIASTFNTPLLYGGPASVVWCWFFGTFGCFTLGTSIAEIVSAYPTDGGMYSASAYLVPRKYRGPVGWTVGWLNILGQISAISSVEFSLAGMILSAVSINTDGAYQPTAGQTVGLFVGLLALHALLNSVATRPIAKLTQTFVFINLGSLVAICIACLATCKDFHPASYVFGSAGLSNQTGWSNNGLSFLLGILSVSWTMTDYDGAAHISEEVKKASIAAPAAIFIAVIGTGVCGWILNVVLVLCSGPLDELPGVGGYAMATIIARNVGKKGFLALWFWVCLCAFTVVSTELQACSRTVFAFSRDRGFPDRGLFQRLSGNKVPVFAVLFVVFWAGVFCMLDFASIVAVDAVYAMCALALDSSYIIPIACRLIFRDHPDVQFKPGPFALPPTLSKIFSIIAICWTCFVCVILSLPQIIPVTASTMNYAAPITGFVLLVTGIWYIVYAHKVYHGPRNIVEEERMQAECEVPQVSGEVMKAM